MEAIFLNLFSPGEKIIVVNGGKFGERWVKLPRVFGIETIEIKNPWGTAPSEEEIVNALKQNPDAKGVCFIHSETSTGTATDIKLLSKVVRENSNAMVVVDGITAIGAHEFRFDDWGIDACVTGSQKGLMIPPGLAFVALSKRAIEATKNSKTPKFYFDLKKALKSFEGNDTPFTPAVSLVIGVDIALQEIRNEGIENVWARHELLANTIRAGVTAIGLKLFSNSPSFAVTPIWLPESVEWKKFNKILKGKYGITVAGGQDDFKDKIFRVSHLGFYDELDMITVIGAIELSLTESGYEFETGSGTKAVQNILSQKK